MINKWDKLKYFYEVAKDLSISKAAERLNISQTSLSKHVKDLEHIVGQELFERETYGLKLTKKGEDLFFYVEKMQ